MPAKFEFPATLTKTISPATTNIYRAKLNKLAAAGYGTPAALVANQAAVCKIIRDTAVTDDDKGRQIRRLFLSAVFLMLGDRPLSDKQTYYDEFQKAKQNYKAPTPVTTTSSTLGKTIGQLRAERAAAKAAAPPVPITEPEPIVTKTKVKAIKPKHKCPTCGKEFINLTQHITKSHTSYDIIFDFDETAHDYVLTVMKNGGKSLCTRSESVGSGGNKKPYGIWQFDDGDKLFEVDLYTNDNRVKVINLSDDDEGLAQDAFKNYTVKITPPAP